MRRRSSFLLISASALLTATTNGFAQTHAMDFPDPRQRVEMRFDDPTRQINARTVRVRDSQCRETVTEPRTETHLRQRIINLAAREWEAFHFPVVDIASENLPFIPFIHTKKSGSRGHSILPMALNTIMAGAASSRMLRNGLMEDDPAIAARIGGYWAVVPNAGAIATQNIIWGKGGWPGAGWAQPWSAAFISWVMCEAGLARAQFLRAPSHANYIAAFFQNAAASAYTAKPLSEKPDMGDLLCAGRDKERPITTLSEAEQAARDDAPMHCDLVVGLLPDRVLLIGGNVQNSVAMTIAPRAPDGAIVATEQRRWFGLMKLNAPPDKKADLARTPWQCLGQKNNVHTCLNNL